MCNVHRYLHVLWFKIELYVFFQARQTIGYSKLIYIYYI